MNSHVQIGNWYIILLIISIALNILLMFGAGIIIFKHRQSVYNALLLLLKRRNGNIKIAIGGDSRMENGNWSKGLLRSDVRNCAIGGSLTMSYLGNLQETVIKYNPKVCILQLGINDIRNRVEKNTTLKNYIEIIDTLQESRILPVVTSIIPIRKDYWQDEISETEINIKVDSLNQHLLLICEERNIPFWDLNAGLTEKNRLKRECTFDGIHLNDHGYDLLYRTLNGYLKNRAFSLETKIQLTSPYTSKL